MLTYFIAFLNNLENERKAVNMWGEMSLGYRLVFISIFLNFQSQHWLYSSLATSCSFNWCLRILFSLSSAPDNVSVTVYGLISMNCFTMIDSLTGPVIGCLVCSVTK